MPLRSKVVITCAVTGSIHTPTMSPYLPLTPDEVARDAIALAEVSGEGTRSVFIGTRGPCSSGLKTLKKLVGATGIEPVTPAV